MACGGMGGCGGSSSNKTSNHAPKKTPNWGMKPYGGSKKNVSNNSGSFGSPKVRMSFSGKSRRGY